MAKLTIMWCRGWGGPVPARWADGDELVEKLKTKGYFSFGGETLDATVEVINTLHPEGKKRLDGLRRYRLDPRATVSNESVLPGVVAVCTMSG